MEILRRGAEGDIYKTVWESRDCVVKIRRSKPYRHPDLDAMIRRRRTVREAEMLLRVKSAGVPAPALFFLDARRHTIAMEYLHGEPAHEARGARFVRMVGELGRITGLLHRNGIMHGDLTTSNFIVSERISLVDFGLSARTVRSEDHAVDLRLFKEILGSAHADEMEEAWPEFLSGYGSIVGERTLGRIERLVAVIEGRGRYARVV